MGLWVRSSVVERVPDKNEVVGPIPTAPTEVSTDKTPFMRCFIVPGLAKKSKKC